MDLTRNGQQRVLYRYYTKSSSLVSINICINLNIIVLTWACILWQLTNSTEETRSSKTTAVFLQESGNKSIFISFQYVKVSKIALWYENALLSTIHFFEFLIWYSNIQYYNILIHKLTRLGGRRGLWMYH